MPNKENEKRKAYERGIISEKATAFYLRAKGYQILEERFRSGQGEIDLIAKKGKCIIFVEVKSRKTIEDGLNAITSKQRARIISAAEIWLSKNPVEFEECRFDVVLLTPCALPRHIKNAFLQ